ncbi:MAG: DUF3800 domain-containing protein [Dehalococcoidia bacterium]
MFILYLDESGTHSDARYFVVAGIAVHESETFYLAQDLDGLQARYFPGSSDPIAFHASPLRSAFGQSHDPYIGLERARRRELSDDIFGAIVDSRPRLFAVAMEKAYTLGDCYDRGFEEIVNRFDRMLGRFARDGNQQRGLIVAAESSYRENLETLARKIAREGHRWGRTRNLADIPYFAPAANTRLLQAADFVANAVYGRYENGYARDFDRIAVRFDQDSGGMYGLVHLHANRGSCYCPSCIAWRSRPRPAGARLLDDESPDASG